MYQQRVKLHQISSIAIGLAGLFAIIALFKAILILVLVVIYCIAASLICEGLAFQLSFNKRAGLRLLLLGVLLFVMTTFLLIHYIKS